MPIVKNHGVDNANLSAIMMGAGANEESNRRMQEYLQMLMQIRGQNMNDILSRDQLALEGKRLGLSQQQQDQANKIAEGRLELDKKRNEFDTFNTGTTLRYTPRKSTPIGENFQPRGSRGLY